MKNTLQSLAQKHNATLSRVASEILDCTPPHSKPCVPESAKKGLKRRAKKFLAMKNKALSAGYYYESKV